MTDPTAQMGFQVGKSAVMAGQEYVEQNVRQSVDQSEAIESKMKEDRADMDSDSSTAMSTYQH